MGPRPGWAHSGLGGRECAALGGEAWEGGTESGIVHVCVGSQSGHGEDQVGDGESVRGWRRPGRGRCPAFFLCCKQTGRLKIAFSPLTSIVTLDKLLYVRTPASVQHLLLTDPGRRPQHRQWGDPSSEVHRPPTCPAPARPAQFPRSRRRTVP